jgi:uncharacterized protein (DUF1697 family)
MRYVVLLRGVNVGGNHRVPKDELRAALESLGFRDIVTYINSGNAVFTSDSEPSGHIIQTALEAQFGFDIPTLLLTANQIKAVAAAIPPEWTNDTPQPDKSGQKSDVLYLFDDINTPDIVEKLGYKPEVETMIYVDRAVLANISRKNQMKGSMQKLIGTKMYSRVTIRNITTAKKLAELVG